MHALQSTKQKQQFAMATTTRSFPVSTTTQHDVHAWQAGRGEHLAMHCHNQNLKLTATRSQVKHESTHRRDCRGSTRPHLRREGYIRRLLYLSQPTVTTSQGVRRPSLFLAWKRLRRLVRPMDSLPRGPFTIKTLPARLRSVLTLSRSRLPSHPAATTQLRPQNPVHFASLSVQHGKVVLPDQIFCTRDDNNDNNPTELNSREEKSLVRTEVPCSWHHFAACRAEKNADFFGSLREWKPLLHLLSENAERNRSLGFRETLFSFETIWMDGVGIEKETGGEGDIIGRNSRGSSGGDNGKMLRSR